MKILEIVWVIPGLAFLVILLILSWPIQVTYILAKRYEKDFNVKLVFWLSGFLVQAAYTYFIAWVFAGVL